MQIRKAVPGEAGLVCTFYQTLIRKLNEKQYGLPWRLGVYPTTELLESAITEQTLYLCLNNREIIGAAIMNRVQGEGYADAHWLCHPPASQIGVIHLLCTDPDVHGQGIGMQLITALIAEARIQNIKSLRLDVLNRNQPAIRLYEKAGFQQTDIVQLDYPSTGLTTFRLYEYTL